MFKKNNLAISLITACMAFFPVQTLSGQETLRPSILLYTCNYGAGHKMATQGIMESLPDCDIEVIDIYDGPLRSLDPLRKSAPQFSNEKLYNLMAKKEYNHLLNFAGRIAPRALAWQKSKMEDLLSCVIANTKPDLVISCIPLVNSVLLSATQKLNIPFLVVTTDIDIKAFCYGFEDHKSLESRKKFRISVPYAAENWYHHFGRELPLTAQYALQYSFGYPTRLSFSLPIEETVLDQVRKEYQILPDENVILVMMGGNTAKGALAYGKQLVQMNDKEIDTIIGKDNLKDKIRLICLCGDLGNQENQALLYQLSNLNSAKEKPNNRVVIFACAGTSKIAELVSLPELFTVISKPGGSTVNEMIKKRVPMIYHVSSVPLDWELGNMQYGEKQGYGKSYKIVKGNKTQTAELAEVLSYTFALHQQIQNGAKTVPEAEIDFRSNLRETIREMLN